MLNFACMKSHSLIQKMHIKTFAPNYSLSTVLLLLLLPTVILILFIIRTSLMAVV